MAQSVMRYPTFKLPKSYWARGVLFPHSPEDIAAVERGETLEGLSVDSQSLLTLVTADLEAYYATNKPELEHIHTYMAMTTLWCKRIANRKYLTHYGSSAPTRALDCLRSDGRAAYDYVRYQLTEKVAESDFSVLGMARLCSTYGLRNHKSPSLDGVDLIFSYDPIENAVFDNDRFIPSHEGYYSIVGKGSARD